MEDLLRIISAGGTPLILVIAYVLWKFDRRLVKIEAVLSNHLSHLVKDEEEKPK